MPPLRVALLGCGAINSHVAQKIGTGEAGPVELAAVLVRTERTAEQIGQLGAHGEALEFTTDAGSFFGAEWALCVEAAGQPAVREHALRCLAAGRDFMITSIGALTDVALYDELRAAAEAAGGGRFILCTGSIRRGR
jgi:aspartate dehydrogenase